MKLTLLFSSLAALSLPALGSAQEQFGVDLQVNSTISEKDEASLTSSNNCNYPTGSGRRFSMQCSSRKLRFAVTADWGTQENRAPIQSIVDSLYNQRNQLDFIVAAGDNFYEDGVTDVDDPQWTSTWFDRYRIEESNTLWISALGNHDHHGNAWSQVEYTTASI